ncbi:MAG TPA: flagellar FliJ family protein [Fimbriimonadaceae bacterium]|nr:flagellar FliJ family protein [Fimbriimonadaceae bacterium]
MKKFEFRLQKVLDFRAAMEEMAKDAYLDARNKRIEAEALITAIEDRRREILEGTGNSLAERQSTDDLMIRLDDEKRSQMTIISVLRSEEDSFNSEWIKAKQDREALEKLREKAQVDYDLEISRSEQKELDEWSVTRRLA